MAMNMYKRRTTGFTIMGATNTTVVNLITSTHKIALENLHTRQHDKGVLDDMSFRLDALNSLQHRLTITRMRRTTATVVATWNHD